MTTPDVMGAPAREREMLDLNADFRQGAERIGGVEVGKCLVGDDATKASIVIDSGLPLVADGDGKLRTTWLVAHEFGHLVHDVCRSAVGIQPLPDTAIPWEVAGVVAIGAAAEFRADRVATVIVDSLLTASGENGEPLSART
jgi:hypothetical protein